MDDKKPVSFFWRMLLAPFMAILNACSPLGGHVDEDLSKSHFYTKNGKAILYCSNGNWFALGKTQMQVDMATFKVLNSLLSKDKNHVYFKSMAVSHKDLDLNSLTATNKKFMGHYGMDRKHVYYLNAPNYFKAEIRIIESADPNSFEAINASWAVDRKDYYFKNRPLGVDRASFEFVSGYFSKDAYKVYYHNSSKFFGALEADPASFEKLNYYYAIDDDHIYYFRRKIEGTTVNTVIKVPYAKTSTIGLIENEKYIKVGKYVYFAGFALPVQDLESFKTLKYGYSKDNKNVYYEHKILEGADAATFAFDTIVRRYRDKLNTYHLGKIE